MSKTVAMSESELRNVTESSSMQRVRGEPSSFTGNLPKDQGQGQDRIPHPTPKSR